MILFVSKNLWIEIGLFSNSKSKPFSHTFSSIEGPWAEFRLREKKSCWRLLSFHSIDSSSFISLKLISGQEKLCCVLLLRHSFLKKTNWNGNYMRNVGLPLPQFFLCRSKSVLKSTIRGQFHQRSTCSFYICKLRAQLFCAYVLGLHFTGVSLTAQKLHVECWWNWLQVSISSTFYVRLIHTKVLNKVFLYLHFRFEIFWRENIGANALIQCWWSWSQNVSGI